MAPRQRARLSDPDDDGVQDVELAEVDKQSQEADGEYVAVPVADTKARVKPQADWRMSDMRHLNRGDFDAWAESVIHPDDLDEFMELDITMGEFADFAQEAARLTGDGLGKSSKHSGSSKTTRKR